MKRLCCFVMAAAMLCALPAQAEALTKEQKTVEELGIDVTWFDFGKAYQDYRIQDTGGLDFYTLTLSNDATGVFKTGFVNGKGEMLIEPAAEQYSTVGSDGDRSVLTSHRGDTLIYGDVDGIRSIDVSAYSDTGIFRDGYATATLKSDGNKAVIDKHGNLIFKDETGKYKGFTYLGSGIFAAEIEENKYDFLDHEGTLLSKFTYTNEWLRNVSEERLTVARDAKYGFMDLSGNEVIPLIYDEAYSFNEGLAAVCKGGKWGYIDKNGKEVIALTYDRVDSSFRDGLASVSLNEKWGMIDKNGNLILPLEYEDRVYTEDGHFYITRKDGDTYLMDASGKLVSDEYSYIRTEENGQVYVSKMMNGSTVNAYLDKNHEMLTGFKEFALYPLSERLYLGKRSGDYPPGVTPPRDYGQRFAILDGTGNNLTGFQYANVRWGEGFRNDFQVVMQYYFGGAGLVNRHGAEVLPAIFEDIILTAEGYAFVSIKDENTGENSRVGYFKIPAWFDEVKGNLPVTVYLDGVELYFDSEPVIKNGRTMVPVRKIFESLGAEVEWDESTRTVSAVKEDKTIKLTIGSSVAFVNGSEVQLDTAPWIREGRTLVPLRFVSEHLGADVQWDDAQRRVVVTTEKE